MRKSAIVAGAVAVLAVAGLAFADSGHGNGEGSHSMPGMHQIMQGQRMAQGMMGQGAGGMGGMGSGTMGQGMQQHGAAPNAQAGDEGPASMAYRGANEKMHRDMAIVYSGDADADFVRGMIPHHQGAIDMAKTVIAFGKDPEIRKLAEAIVAAQEKEIAGMKTWLSTKAK